MSDQVNADWVFAQYERMRPVLPDAVFPAGSSRIDRLAEVFELFDAILFDAFGVLNVGDTPVPGAANAISDLQRRGKQVFVLTNGARYPAHVAVGKFKSFGFELDAGHVIASRDVLCRELQSRPERHWGLMAPADAGGEELPLNSSRPLHNRLDFESVEGFVLLSSAGWSEEQQDMLVQSLLENPRPVLVGNPDIVAPRESGFSRQTGWYAADIIARTGISPRYFGKPFADIFDLALSRLVPDVPKDRVLMVGDTLHTDVLGAAAAGIKTLLLTDYGIFAGRDVAPFIEQSGIVPHWVCKTY